MSAKSQKVKNILTWVLQVLLGLEFLIAGQAKFTASEIWSASFEKWGYPDGFLYFVGVFEMVVAVFVFIPRFTSYATLLLAGVMLVASVTHFLHAENGIGPLVIMAFLILAAYLRKDKAMKLKR